MIVQTIAISYSEWLQRVKERIYQSRIKAALAANAELINFYWDLGKMMLDVSEKAQRGKNWVEM